MLEEKDDFNFINKVHRRIAQVSVGPSAIRNQGASGIIEICRNYFEKRIDLIEFRGKLETNNYKTYLDLHTENLVNQFPKGGRSWGAARKGLNLFFREVCYNFYLANHLNIPRDFNENRVLVKDLEVPLDKDVAVGLNRIYPKLPKWKSIKQLKPKESELYQLKALEHANELYVSRVHLDLVFWRNIKY